MDRVEEAVLGGETFGTVAMGLGTAFEDGRRFIRWSFGRAREVWRVDMRASSGYTSSYQRVIRDWNSKKSGAIG
jgi:hypothetical protein